MATDGKTFYIGTTLNDSNFEINHCEKLKTLTIHEKNILTLW